MILLTGAGGFIGSNLLSYLNEQGSKDIVIVDDLTQSKLKNIINKKYKKIVHRDHLFDWLTIYGKNITVVYHLGARTDTTEQNQQIFHYLNLSYSKRIWQFCTHQQIPLVYASSAATYGLGNLGFIDAHHLCTAFSPLNPYAVSKNEFDKWVLRQSNQPPFWAGLKFFNVYGPNEYHKGRMASVVFHAFQQIQQTGKMKLFRSHREDIKDGYQQRDFIYIQNICELCYFFMTKQPVSGLYNAGTGQARTFLDLVTATFNSMNLTPSIEFIDTPIDIRDTYQYFTEANMQKTRKAGYRSAFTSLEEGVDKYVRRFLVL